MKKVVHYNFFIIYKNEWNNLLPKKQRCYKNDQERLRDNARDKYRNLFAEEKNKKREYGKIRYHNMSKEKKQILKEYQKNYCEANKRRKS